MSRPARPFCAELYDAIEAGYYDRVFRRGRGVQWFWHDGRFKEVERRLPPAVGSLLDLGCGPGTFLGRLAGPPERALGIDLSEAQVAYAREHYARDGLTFLRADVRDLPVSERFDAVVSIEVLEHLPIADTRPFLDSIFQRLKPRGVAILTTPNYRSHWLILERLLSRLGPVDYRAQHINRFDARRLELELRAVGFEEVEVDSFFVFAPWLAPISERLAQRMASVERRWFQRWGAELIARAVRP